MYSSVYLVLSIITTRAFHHGKTKNWGEFLETMFSTFYESECLLENY